jgi:hypothetical protein
MRGDVSSGKGGILVLVPRLLLLEFVCDDFERKKFSVSFLEEETLCFTQKDEKRRVSCPSGLLLSIAKRDLVSSNNTIQFTE